MKKEALTSLIILLSASVFAENLFGIEFNGTTTDNIINLISSLAQGDEEQALRYSKRLEKTGPHLARKVRPNALKVPCSNCKGKGILDDNRPCPACNGTRNVVDPYSLLFLQNKFYEAIEAGTSDKTAWQKAKSAFDKRRKMVLTPETLDGTLVRKEGRGALLTRKECGERIYVEGFEIPEPCENIPISGEVWLVGTQACTGDDGKPTRLKRYTATLWMN